MRKGTRIMLGALALTAALAGGVAYATIPDEDGVYSACAHDTTGALRLIDPSLGESTLLGRCRPNETLVTWALRGEQGPQGAAGPQGPQGEPGSDGADGRDGASPVVAQLAPGDPSCPDGGASITDAAGTTAYVCSGRNGADGADGEPFSGTFVSPNGQYSITVDDTGIELRGPGPGPDRIRLAGGAIRMDAPGTLTAMIGGNVDIRSATTLALRGDVALDLRTSGTATVVAGGPLNLRSSSIVSLNGASSCRPAARVNDLVAGSSDAAGSVTASIVTGSPIVCIG